MIKKQKSLVWIILIFVFSFKILVAAAEVNRQVPNAIPEVLIAGDSWSQVPCLFGSVAAAFLSRGYRVDTSECRVTSQIGAHADKFKRSSEFKTVLRSLQSRPQIKVVYLSLGGNDMFSHWSKNLTAHDEDTLFYSIKQNIEEIVREIHRQRPEVWILVSGYDFAYIHEHNAIAAYEEIYEHMGRPSTTEVNAGFERFAQVMAKLSLDHAAYQQHFGLMHYYFGVPEASIPAFKTTPPDLISPVNHPEQFGGISSAKNSTKAMMRIFDYYVDPHHLGPNGYLKLYQHAIDAYIGPWLMNEGIMPSQDSKFPSYDDMDLVIPEAQKEKILKMLSREFSL